MEDRLKRMEAEDFIMDNQEEYTPEQMAESIKSMQRHMAQRQAKQLIPAKKSNGLLLVKKRTSPGIRRSR